MTPSAGQLWDVPCEAPRQAPKSFRILAGAARSFALDGAAPYSTVSAKPLNAWLNHIVIVPWQLLPQRSREVGRPSARATRLENFGRCGDVDGVEGLVEGQDVSPA